MRVEIQIRFYCFCNGPLVVKLRVHPIAGFLLLSVVGVRPPLHAVILKLTAHDPAPTAVARYS